MEFCGRFLSKKIGGGGSKKNPQFFMKFFKSNYTESPSGNEPKSRKLLRRAPSAERRALSKIEQADCPSKSEKNILELDKQ